jgi:hypothetical protein
MAAIAAIQTTSIENSCLQNMNSSLVRRA